ncbi:hypothetical protein ACFY04_22570 [Streptomyces sp. NPDC001549]|uniref:hypothetical protein n=1 Tax=Streptomyces sp. NPDC001549 TaxID=3364586 RepID=UPI0036A40A72
MWISLTVSANLFEDDSARRRPLMLFALLRPAAMAAAGPEADSTRGAAPAD